MDLRFKTIFFDKDQCYPKIVKNSLLSMMKEESDILNSPESQTIKLNLQSDECTKSSKSFWDYFQEIGASSNWTEIQVVDESAFHHELDNYLSQPLTKRKTS